MDSLIIKTSAVTLGTKIKVNDNSKFFLQLGDSNFRLSCRDTILEYPGLYKRCIQDGNDIVCVLPTSSSEMISVLAVIFTQLSIDLDTLNFLDYLDPELPQKFISIMGTQRINLKIPYLDYQQLTDLGIEEPYMSVSTFPEFRTDLLSFFKEPKELSSGINVKYMNHVIFSHEYIPGIVRFIRNNISVVSLSYILNYIRAYEIYFAITGNLPVIVYTDEIDTLKELDNKKYKPCLDNLVNGSISREGHLKVERSYFDIISIIRGRLKSNTHYKQIKTILNSGLGVVTGGFIAACMYNTDYSDIDICLESHVDINEVKAMFDDLIESNDARFRVGNLDIFVSPTHMHHTISTFHMSVVRAYYNGDKLYMFPSCLISALNNVVHVNPLRLSIPSVQKYRDRGFTLEDTWLRLVDKDIKPAEKKEDPLYSYFASCYLSSL